MLTSFSHRAQCLCLFAASVCLVACDGGRHSGGNPLAPFEARLAQAADHPSTGLQGQIPVAEQRSGRAQEGYWQGLRLVGQADILARGANFQLAWLGDCAYVSSGGENLDPQHEMNGVAVIDAADPTQPQLVSVLRSPGAVNSKIALETNAPRGILAVASRDTPVIDLYAAPTDCSAPVLISSIVLEVPVQGLRLAPDGLTLYAVDAPGELRASPDPAIEFAGSSPRSDDIDELVTPLPGLLMYALDDLSQPELLLRWDPNTHLRPELTSPVGTDDAAYPPAPEVIEGDPVHLPQPPDPERSGPPTIILHDIDLNERGSRVYLSNSAGPKNGVMILDVASVQRRRSRLRTRIVGQVSWDHDLGGANAVEHFIRGERTYLLVTDTLASPRLCPWGHARMIEITKEWRPELLAPIALEVNDKANCPSVFEDEATYSAHYPSVDDKADATTAFFSWFASGLRVFDIRDPTAPVEVAYYMPPPIAELSFATDDSLSFDAATDFWDATTSRVRYRPDTGHVWFVSIENGLQILEFTDSAGATPSVSAEITAP